MLPTPEPGGRVSDQERTEPLRRRNMERSTKVSVKIKISYETEEELKRVLMLLDPVVKNWTRAAKKSGKFFRAYITLDNKKK